MSTGRLLWRMVIYRPWLYAANVVIWTAICLFPLPTGLIVREFFDTLAGQPRYGFSVAHIIGAVLAVALARVTIIALGALTDIRHRFTMKTLLTTNLLERVLEQPGAVALQETIGEAISRFREDVRQIEDALSLMLDGIGLGSFAVLSMLILARIDTQVTMLTFLPLLAVTGLSRLAAQRVEQYRLASRAAASAAVGALGEAFTAVQAVKLAVAEEHVAAHVSRLNERRRQLQLKDRLVTELLDSINSNAVSIGTGLVLLLAASSMSSGTFSVGDFSLFVYYLSFVSDFTSFVGRMLVHLKQTGVSFGRLVELLHGEAADRLVRHSPIYLDQPPPPADEPARGEDPLRELAVQGLTCLYPNSDRGVHDLSFTVERGSFVVITGRIGSGKTTALRGLLGQVPLASGEIRWNGRPVTEPRVFFAPPRAAYTAQVPVLFSETLGNNIRLGWPGGDEEIAGAVRLAVFEEDLAEMPAGLGTMVGARGLRLSGGQQHRVAAARMFLRRPELLVIDDLSSAVDVETEAAIWNRLFAERQLTCLVVSHRRAALRRADWILVLQDGRLADAGRLEDLLERCEEMRQIWGTGWQAGEQVTPAVDIT